MVAPLDIDDKLMWIDPAGYTVAVSNKPNNWPDYLSGFTFELDILTSTVTGDAYLLHG
jgi:hypothetical protein